MPIHLRRMQAGDEPMFERIAPEVFDEPINADWLATYLATPGHLMLLAFDEATIVGQCTGVIQRHPDKPHELFVDELGTAETHRRQGIGSKLLAAMLDWGRELGCGEAWLTTDLDNEPAKALYSKLGGAGEQLTYFEFKL